MKIENINRAIEARERICSLNNAIAEVDGARRSFMDGPEYPSWLRGDSAFLALFQHRIIHSGDGTILKVENFLIERLTQLLREVEREIEEL